MFTSIDKAIVAAVMALLAILNFTTGWHLGVSEETVGAIIAVCTPIFVYLVPNKA